MLRDFVLVSNRYSAPEIERLASVSARRLDPGPLHQRVAAAPLNRQRL